MSSVVLDSGRRDAAVISLVGLVHGLSHFLQLAMPTMFLAIRRDLDVSFAALGLAATVFYVVSGLCQTIAGFAVDRYGARPMMFAGVTLLAGAVGLMGLAPNMEALLVCAAIGGVGNSMFHPADFGILNSAVSVRRLGPAFSVHGISGNIGWALAPPVMTAFSLWFGGWRPALIGAGVIGLLILALAWFQRDLLAPASGAKDPVPVAEGSGAAVLLAPRILLCFTFFLLLAAGLIGIQTFGMPILTQLHHLTPEVAAITLTSFLLAGGAGVLCGGFLVARTTHHEHVAAGGMAIAAAFIALAAGAQLPPWAILVALGGAGFFSGLTNPSRDFLVRAAAPPGSTGKVYGFVYSGLDAGSAIVPSIFGWMLDHGRGSGVIYAIAGLWLATIAIIYAMKSASVRSRSI